MKKQIFILTLAFLLITLVVGAQEYDSPLPLSLKNTEAIEDFENNPYDLVDLKDGGELGLYMSFKYGNFHGKPFGKFMMDQGLTEEDFRRHYVSKMQDNFVDGANEKLSGTNLKFVENKVVRYMLKIEYEDFDSDGEHEAYYILVDTEQGKTVCQFHYHEGDSKNSVIKAGRKFASNLMSSLAKIK